ncbi:hypothetical protein HPB47_017243 [Ixodes persulcatus]|uniref:Uncharacterized protein n=1 Tax=Ixodes persulcatus TaxID=34615 RepID=A0AC60QSH6_IXOPE|nr:hypothetical protein HPB47_017243 [Ixodes persulcatus]
MDEDPSPATLLDFDSAKMAKKLEKSLRHLNRLWAKNEEVLSSPKVDIGSGVLVEQTTLDGLKAAGVSASKYVRGLLKAVFSTEELKGKSLRGRKCNAQKEGEVKPALDPVKLKAVIDFVVLEAASMNVKPLLTFLLSPRFPVLVCIFNIRALDWAIVRVDVDCSEDVLPPLGSAAG